MVVNKELKESLVWVFFFLVLAGIFCDFTTKIMLLCAIFSLSKRLYILLQLVSRLNYFLVVDVNTLAHLRNVQESDYLLSLFCHSIIN